MSTGIVLPYESAAMRGDEMPDGLSMPDQMLFLALRSLYWQVRKGIIDRDRAVLEKRKLLDDYRVQKFKYSVWLAAAKREQSIELQISAVLHDKSLMQNEKIKSLISAIDGIRR